MTEEVLALAALVVAYGGLLIVTLTRSAWTRPAVCATAAIGTGGYLAWRWITAVPGLGAAGAQPLFTVLCLAFETAFAAEFWIFLLLMARRRDRRDEADLLEARFRAQESWPAVDVFITTYNEDFNVIEKSIVGALRLDYPNFTVHVLDDGRRAWLAEFCARVGANYFARPDNRDKKAGNHNYALARTSAPFIAVFDADFVPYRHFLWRTLGFFEAPEIGIVQTPQALFNKDSFQNNLLLQKVLPDEQRFFFNHVMPCRDAWDSAFYCGSAAVLRRDALASIGGVVTGLATEDQVTSVAMLAQGYRTIYLNEQLSWGLAPESTWAFLEQRKRWCRGGVQLLYRHDGPLGPATRRWRERLFFLPTYWLLGFISPFYFIALALLPWFLPLSPFFNVPPDATLIATVLVTLIYSHTLLWLSQGTWVPILSPAFNLFQACHLAPTALTTLIKPFGRPLLNFLEVTPKGARAAAGRVNFAVLIPLLGLFIFLSAGILKSTFLDSHTRDLGELVTNTIWAVIFAAHLAVAGVAAMELPYRRTEERFELRLEGEVEADGRYKPCRIQDLSLAGARLDRPVDGVSVRLRVEGYALDATVVRSTPQAAAVRFDALSDAQRHWLIARLYTANTNPPVVPRFPILIERTLRRLIYP